MRKCYVVIGSTTEGGSFYTWISGVKSSWQKACKMCKMLKDERPQNDYSIQVEIID